MTIEEILAKIDSTLTERRQAAKDTRKTQKPRDER